mgnify:FL=1
MSSENRQGICWHCKQPLKAYDYQRENRCPGCSKATHCCRNCEYYKPGIANSCREPIADHVNDKGRANFCDYFSPASEAGHSSATADPEQLLLDAEDLFK